MREALAAAVGDRYLVVVFLDGGNDGLNTVTPYDNGGGTLRDDYEAARNAGGSGLRLAPAELLVPQPVAGVPDMLDPNTGAQLGLHPGLAGLSSLYEQGRVAVIQGCGYPDYNLSHDISTTAWETGDPLGALAGGTGWVGRYLASMYTPSEIPGVSVLGEVAGELQQTGTSVLAVRRLKDFGFPFDQQYPGDEAARRAAFEALYASAQGNANPILEYIGNSGSSTLLATDSYPPLHSAYENARGTWSQMYDDLANSTARDLREVAKIVYGVANGASNVNARFFEVRNGGYDTHSNQGGADPNGHHYELHREVGDAIKLFYDDVADMQPGLADKLCVVVWSEFSRRIFQNDNGTDHGSQGPMFVIGGSVNGGVYGNHPNIAEAALDDNGNTPYAQAGSFRSTDFRDVYGTILRHWLNLPNPSAILPVDGGDPAAYWTVPNFDLGFL